MTGEKHELESLKALMAKSSINHSTNLNAVKCR